MKCLVVLLCCLVALGSTNTRMGAYNDMKRKVDKYNLFSQCFGAKSTHEYYKAINDANESCKEHGNSVDGDDGLVGNPVFERFARSKRSIDLEDLKESIPEHTLEVKSSVERLGCVLRKMNYLDSDSNLKVWAYEDLKKAMAASPVGSDDEMMHKMANMYKDCKDIAEAWPQTMLDRHPYMAKYGRKKIYLECRHKGEMELCYKWQIYQGMKMEHGIDTGSAGLSLGGDKFEQAKVAWVMAFEHNEDEEGKFVNDFFWSQNRD